MQVTTILDQNPLPLNATVHAGAISMHAHTAYTHVRATLFFPGSDRVQPLQRNGIFFAKIFLTTVGP